MPELRIDMDAIGRNTEVVAGMLRSRGLDLVAVTKGCLGEPRVAAAMLAGGAVAVADTRDQNLRRLRTALPDVELHRIHLPSISGPFEPGDVTYVSSLEGALAVAACGTTAGPRRVMVQVETGDRREGVPLEGLVELANGIAGEPRLRLAGVSTNYACFMGRPEGIMESVESVVGAAAALREAGLPVDRVSGGNSSLLWLLAQGQELPGGLTELRCGEALLLGQDALFYRPLPGCRTEACVLRAEVLEEYTKPAAGGVARRYVLGVGRQDLGSGVVRFAEPGLYELGRSADYLVAEAEVGCLEAPVGTKVDMIPSYEALVAAWTSPYVEVGLLGG
ncbi:MAG: alanine racemase [Thermoleophilia bacterium]|nr:alanine racemase [Thermoleophilia bacterium]